jgi:hypothetical protein
MVPKRYEQNMIGKGKKATKREEKMLHIMLCGTNTMAIRQLPILKFTWVVAFSIVHLNIICLASHSSSFSQLAM